MTPALRWRILSLQSLMVVVLAFAAGFLFWAASFTHSDVHDELVSQKITFAPAAALSPKEYTPAEIAALKQYAGQQLVTGDQARVYANDFIARHLQLTTGGQTYSQISAKSLAAPKNVALANLTMTMFRGETLRGLLLNAWGWWTIGTYAFYAAIVMVLATLAVAGAFIYELFFASERTERSTPVAKGRAVSVGV